MSIRPNKTAEQKDASPPPTPSKGEELTDEQQQDLAFVDDNFHEEEFDIIDEVEF